MSFNVSFEDSLTIRGNLAAWDGNSLAFLSAFGTITNIKNTEQRLRIETGINVAYNRFKVKGKDFNIYTSKAKGTDFMHIILSRKDEIKNTGYKIYCFFNSPDTEISAGYRYGELSFSASEDVYDLIYNKLNNVSSVPILKEWMPYITRMLYQNYSLNTSLRVHNEDDNISFKTLSIDTSDYDLRNIITIGLQNSDIEIPGNGYVSDKLLETEKIEEYLTDHSEVLSKKIRGSFKPRFIPGTDNYSKWIERFCDYAEYNGHLKMYEAQKAVSQACANMLSDKKSTFIIGECSSGKTALSIAAINTHAANKRGLCNIIMCPGHIVNKWKKEVLRLSPLSDVEIVDSFSKLLELESTIKNPRRKRNLWLVISKDCVKFSYLKRPAAIWRDGTIRNPGGFVCPTCGQYIKKKVRMAIEKDVVRRGRVERVKSAEDFYFNLTPFEFADQFKNKGGIQNIVCKNMIKKWNTEIQSYEDKECNTPLWTVHNRFTAYENGAARRWVKTKDGWFPKEKIQSTIDEFKKKLDDGKELEKNEVSWFDSLTTVQEGDYTDVAPRRYSISRYIREHMKGYIDYLVLDEIHELKGGDSLQGLAFGDLAQTAKKCIGLTGTLLNGYANGIYYLLFRLFTKEMLKEGYTFESIAKFSKEFGVKSEEYDKVHEYGTPKVKNKKNKVLPGVSPMVFTKFLLENAAFISLEDIADGLPGYKEIPVPCTMDFQQTEGYEALKKRYEEAKDIIGYANREEASRFTTMMIQLMSIWPDQPYNQLNVYKEDGTLLCSPPSLEEDTIRSKETRLLELVREKIRAGEKVLVYYQWSGRTDIGGKLAKLINDSGIKAKVMAANKNSKAKYAEYISAVKTVDREQWIADQINDGMQVLICNPTLIETGLDLLDFTTIIFFEIGYNLFTVRQASRRSWRLNQDNDVEVYFMYYRNTVQETVMKLMANKLKASMAIEGKFTSEGLNAMCDSTDIMAAIAEDITKEINEDDVQVFESSTLTNTKARALLAKQTIADTKITWKSAEYMKKYTNKSIPTRKNSKISRIL